MLILDHMFVLTAQGAPVAQRLRTHGFHEGPGNDHPGQGTSNRRFFFVDSMLELLWVRDADEANAGNARDLQFVQRAGSTDASPFGLVFRGDGEPGTAMPFPGWPYHPAYLDASRFFHIGANSVHLQEPLCVYAPFSMPEPPGVPRNAERVAEVKVLIAGEHLSEVMQAVSETANLTLATGPHHLLEICLDGGRDGGSLDLRPELTLIIHT